MTRSATRRVRKPSARRTLALLLVALAALPFLALEGTSAGAATKPTMRISASPSKRTVAPGQSTSFTVSVIRSSTYKSNVTLSVTSKLPSGVTAKFDTRSIQRNTSLRLSFSSKVKLGTYKFSLKGTGGGRTSTTSVSVLVSRSAPTTEPPVEDTLPPVGGGVPGLPAAPTTTAIVAQPLPTTTTVVSAVTTTTAATTTTAVSTDFTLTATPPTMTVASGDAVVFTININRTGGYNLPVPLAVSGLPAGFLSGFNPNPATGTTAQLTVVAPAGLALGSSYPFTVSSVNRSVNLTLVIGTTTGTATGTGDFALSTASPSQTVAAGATATWPITVTRIGTSATPVTFSITGLPAGATASVSPNPVTGNAAILTVNTAAGVVGGTYPLTLTGTGTTGTQTLALSLVVGGGTSANSGVGDPVVTITPAQQSVAPGASTSYTISLSQAAGAIPPLTFAIGGLPVGVTAGMSANPTSSTATLTIAAATTTVPGTYPLTITGTATGITRTVTITLVVGAAGSTADFQLTAAPTTRAIPAGTANTFAITIAGTGGFNSPVSFAAAASSANLSVGVSPNPATGSATLNVVVAPGTPGGTYTVTVSGTGGGITRAVSVTVTV